MAPDSDGDVKLEWPDGEVSGYIQGAALTRTSDHEAIMITMAASVHGEEYGRISELMAEQASNNGLTIEPAQRRAAQPRGRTPDMLGNPIFARSNEYYESDDDDENHHRIRIGDVIDHLGVHDIYGILACLTVVGLLIATLVLNCWEDCPASSDWWRKWWTTHPVSYIFLPVSSSGNLQWSYDVIP